MFRVTRAQPFILSLLLLLAMPALALGASYGDGDPSEVGVAVFPFEVENSDERSLAFALEAALQRGLPGMIGQPAERLTERCRYPSASALRIDSVSDSSGVNSGPALLCV